MDNTLNLWLGFIVISAVGTFAHFLYDISRENHILGLFTAVNESTWEHIIIVLTATFSGFSGRKIAKNLRNML